MSESEVHLNLILEMIEKIEKDSNKSLNDDLIWDAMLMRFQVVGESVARLPDKTKNKHREVNWRKFYSFRNLISHKYSGVPSDVVANLIQEVPILKKAVNKIKSEVGK